MPAGRGIQCMSARTAHRLTGSARVQARTKPPSPGGRGRQALRPEGIELPATCGSENRLSPY